MTLSVLEWCLSGRFFELVYVDYRTGERIPKDSARWYQKVIENNALTF